MTTFDHAVVLVRDLAAAGETFQRMGFAVQPGGVHPGFGTANALVVLANGYLELLAVTDPDVARAAGPRRRELVELLADGEGLIGYALSAASLDEIRHAPSRDGLVLEPPIEMSRIRPDGVTLAWQLLVPGGSTWRRPWPFLIDWGRSPSPVDGGPGRHPNGARSIAEVTIGANDPGRLAAFFEDRLGLTRPPSTGSDVAGAFVLDGCRLVVERTGATSREGPLRLVIRVADLRAARQLLGEHGVRYQDAGRFLDIDPLDACRARIRLTA